MQPAARNLGTHRVAAGPNPEKTKALVAWGAARAFAIVSAHAVLTVTSRTPQPCELRLGRGTELRGSS